MSFIEPLQARLSVRIGPLLHHRLQARVETWRFTSDSRFAGGALVQICSWVVDGLTAAILT
jgi:hypothetical protein